MTITNKIDIFQNKLREFNESSSRLSTLDDFSKHFEERRKVFEDFCANVF